MRPVRRTGAGGGIGAGAGGGGKGLAIERWRSVSEELSAISTRAASYVGSAASPIFAEDEDLIAVPSMRGFLETSTGLTVQRHFRVDILSELPLLTISSPLASCRPRTQTSEVHRLQSRSRPSLLSNRCPSASQRHGLGAERPARKLPLPAQKTRRR